MMQIYKKILTDSNILKINLIIENQTSYSSPLKNGF